MPTMTVSEIAVLVGGEVRGDPDRSVQCVATLEDATPEALSFIATAKYLPYLQATRAGAVLISAPWVDSVPEACAAVVVRDPHRALRTVLMELHRSKGPSPGIHPTAIIPESVQMGAEIVIGPHVVVGEGVRVGSHARIGAHCVIGADCRLGDGVILHPQVTLYDGVKIGDRVIVQSGTRIGSDGFGYIWEGGRHLKVPQVGGCVIEDDVEIGANVTIDRGSIGDTVVGAGSKIDNLVHVGHNVRVGRNVLLVAQAGIAGSSRVGDGAVLGGQVGIAGHLTIGSGAKLAGQAGVISDVPAGATFSGYPARPHREALRAQAATFKLPDVLRRLKRLEEKLVGRGDADSESDEL
jgi:UDP-3-O-[3-hydroxymyristoyl] glucosamine N-acyltransferase